MTGKLPPAQLRKLLARAKQDPSVIIGPAYGEDAAAVRFGGKTLVATSDPITFATDRIGYYAVSVNANDIAVMGATPRYFLATILLPEGSPVSLAEQVFDQINESCERIGVTLIGGHTEVTSAVTQPVVSGTMLGEAAAGSLVTSAGARVGDALILVGGIAIEGTSILACDARDELLPRGVSADLISRAAGYLDKPGICVLDYAKIAVGVGGVSAMHDPTEGGLATALRELATASQVGLEIVRGEIPILPECDAICSVLGIDPLGLIASGSLILSVSAERVFEMLSAFDDAGAVAAGIGTVRRAETGVRFDDGAELPSFERDEIARYFDQQEN